MILLRARRRHLGGGVSQRLVNREQQQITHKSNGSALANLCKTVQEGPFRLKFTNSHSTADEKQ